MILYIELVGRTIILLTEFYYILNIIDFKFENNIKRNRSSNKPYIIIIHI